jgi:hypothetical protein
MVVAWVATWAMVMMATMGRQQVRLRQFCCLLSHSCVAACNVKQQQGTWVGTWAVAMMVTMGRKQVRLWQLCFYRNNDNTAKQLSAYEQQWGEVCKLLQLQLATLDGLLFNIAEHELNVFLCTCCCWCTAAALLLLQARMTWLLPQQQLWRSTMQHTITTKSSTTMQQRQQPQPQRQQQHWTPMRLLL